MSDETVRKEGFWPIAYKTSPTGTCAGCRFWTDPAGALEFDNKPAGDWKDCARVNKADSLMVFDSQGWHRDGGAVMTRSDFGCVQWERKPKDEGDTCQHSGMSGAVTTGNPPTWRCSECGEEVTGSMILPEWERKP